MRAGVYVVTLLTTVLTAQAPIPLGFNSVDIGTHNYRVWVNTNLDWRYDGTFVYETRRIDVRPLDLHRMQVVAVHEAIIHGCFAETGLALKKTVTEDQVADTLDTCITDLIRSNPKFIAFVQR